jgi:hypothetical protein
LAKKANVKPKKKCADRVHQLEHPIWMLKEQRSLECQDKILTIDPGLSQSLGWSICANGKLHCAGLIDMSIRTVYELAEEFWQMCKDHAVERIIIEKFSHFSGSTTQQSIAGTHARGATVTRMTRLISFLEGFFIAKGYLVKLVPPISWKPRLKGGKKDELRLVLRLFITNFYDHKLIAADRHWQDAIGMYLAEIGVTLEYLREPIIKT